MKNSFENINPNAEIRRNRAEERSELNISHWRGELHSHTKTDISEPELPSDVVEYRKGSNCGDVPLDALLDYHSQEMKNEFIAITEHARDANPEKAISGMTNWFNGMYLSNNAWLEENYLKNKDELSERELAEIKTKAKTQAEQVALYGDERIEQILADIDQAGNQQITVFKGIEASLLPDGRLDTPMIEAGEFDVVNCSVHPDVDIDLFQNIVSNPQKYSDLIILGAENKKVNILSHIGEGLDKQVVENLRWADIAEKALKNKVAIEINLKKLIGYIYKEILDYDKFPKNDTSYRAVLELKLDELVPLLSSSSIGQQLKPFIAEGLKIAINTDEHKNKFIKSETNKETSEHSFMPRDLRYWRAMKIVEKYFNNKFEELGIKKENIINTFDEAKLRQFFSKQLG